MREVRELFRATRVWYQMADINLSALLQEAEKLPDQELLKYYARQWDRYTRGALYVNKLFNYLNKHWVKREKEEGRKDVYQVYTVCIFSSPFPHLADGDNLIVQLALVSWKNNFFDHFADSKGTSRLTQAVLRQIQQQRNGEEIDSGLLKKVIDSYGKCFYVSPIDRLANLKIQSLLVLTRLMPNDKISTLTKDISRHNSLKPPTPITVLNLLHLLIPTLFRTI